jgi:hypothetical protein
VRRPGRPQGPTTRSAGAGSCFLAKEQILSTALARPLATESDDRIRAAAPARGGRLGRRVPRIPAVPPCAVPACSGRQVSRLTIARRMLRTAGRASAPGPSRAAASADQRGTPTGRLSPRPTADRHPALAELDPTPPTEIARCTPLATAWRALERALEDNIKQSRYRALKKMTHPMNLSSPKWSEEATSPAGNSLSVA